MKSEEIKKIISKKHPSLLKLNESQILGIEFIINSLTDEFKKEIKEKDLKLSAFMKAIKSWKREEIINNEWIFDLKEELKQEKEKLKVEVKKNKELLLDNKICNQLDRSHRNVLNLKPGQSITTEIKQLKQELIELRTLKNNQWNAQK